jgi:hypothetical protein
MYQIFEIKLEPSKLDLEENLGKIGDLNWRPSGLSFVKEDDGLEYILDLSNFTLKCVTGDLFLIDEGSWTPEDNSSREELVKSALKELERLPFKLQVSKIIRNVKHA